ncbi:MAG: alkaline phosphatase, partial [Methylobacterium sp.]
GERDLHGAVGFRQRGGTVADALPETDGTVKVALTDLPPGQDILYRIRLEDLAAPTIRGPAQVGRFRTAPADRRSVSFCWSGDTAGQGWGIDEARGGMTIYKAMLGNRPDFFLHSGDTIYADGPITAEVRLPDGTLWRNRVTEAVSKPAETLAEFRGRYQYNLTDANVLAMNAAVPILAQWDDHEVTNNWWPGEPLTRAEHLRKKYADPNVRALEVRASRAFHEYMPMRFEPAEPGRVYRKIAYGPLVDVFMLDMRSYRGPNGENRETRYGPDSYFLGPVQLAWLKRALAESRATWKVIAADMPLGDPNKARFQEFEPFWEFVSGPLHAGTFGPNKLDDTFGPQLRFVKAPPEGQANLSPAAGYQFFGHVAVDGRTEQMTVTLKDAADADLWHVTLDPARG